MLEMQGVSYRYDGGYALSDVYIEVHDESVTAVLGVNGAGKTTSLGILAGLLRPVRGRVLLDGDDISKVGACDRAALGIALCPEGRQVFGDFTVLENLRVGAHLLKKSDVSVGIDYVISIFPELEPLLSRYAGLLSGGEQQMLALGRALVRRPRVLMVDEPSLGLAPTLVHRVFNALSTLAHAGMTVVVVEQNAAAALRLADVVYVLANGRVVRTAPAGEIGGISELVGAYFALDGG